MYRTAQYKFSVCFKIFTSKPRTSHVPNCTIQCEVRRLNWGSTFTIINPKARPQKQGSSILSWVNWKSTQNWRALLLWSRFRVIDETGNTCSVLVHSNAVKSNTGHINSLMWSVLISLVDISEIASSLNKLCVINNPANSFSGYQYHKRSNPRQRSTTFREQPKTLPDSDRFIVIPVAEPKS